MHTQRYGFWGYLILIIGLAGICALLIIINQDVDKERSVCSSDMGNMGGIIFAFFTWGCVFAVLVDPEAKESAIYLQTKKFGRKRPTRIFCIRGYFNRSQLKYSVTLWSVLAA